MSPLLKSQCITIISTAIEALMEKTKKSSTLGKKNLEHGHFKKDQTDPEY